MITYHRKRSNFGIIGKPNDRSINVTNIALFTNLSLENNIYFTRTLVT